MANAVRALLAALDRDTEPPCPLMACGYAASSLFRLGAEQTAAYWRAAAGLAEALAEVKACLDALMELVGASDLEPEARDRARMYVMRFLDCTEIAFAQRWVDLLLDESASRCVTEAQARVEAA